MAPSTHALPTSRVHMHEERCEPLELLACAAHGGLFAVPRFVLDHPRDPEALMQFANEYAGASLGWPRGLEHARADLAGLMPAIVAGPKNILFGRSLLPERLYRKIVAVGALGDRKEVFYEQFIDVLSPLSALGEAMLQSAATEQHGSYLAAEIAARGLAHAVGREGYFSSQERALRAKTQMPHRHRKEARIYRTSAHRVYRLFDVLRGR